MKNILFMLCMPVLIFSFLTACDKNDESPNNGNDILNGYYSSEPSYVATPNKAVKDAFNSEFPSATNTAWEVSNSIYKATFTNNSGLKATDDDANDRCEAWYDDKGKRLQKKEDIRVSDLPQAVKDAIANKYPGYRIDDAEIIHRGNEVFYEIEIEKGDDDIEFYINADGTFRDGSPSHGSGNGVSAAKRDFKTRFPGADDDDWDVFHSFIRVEFEWKGDDDDWEAYYNLDGTWRLTKQELDDDKLPLVIRNAVKSKYGKKCEIDDAVKITEGTVVTYVIAIEDEKDKDLLVYYKEDGTFIKEVVRYDDDDDDDDDDD